MISILLAVYNGEKYLEEQLNSLMVQTYQDFKVIIRDDLSNDSTVALIKEYQMRFPNKIEILEDNLGNLRSSKSFMQLLSCSGDCEYVMFCDQDDIWLPNKIELSLNEIKSLEKTKVSIPLLVFSDLTVVNEKLNIIQESFWRYQSLIPKSAFNWKKLLAQNVITGCTIIMNANAKQVCLPFNLPHMLHDQWIGVNVAKYGKVGFLPEQTILYRQHENNVAGAYRFGFQYILTKFLHLNSTLSQLKVASNYFEGVTFMELLYYKIKINISRMIKK